MSEKNGLFEKRKWSILLPCCIAIFFCLLARYFLGEILSNILFFGGVGVAFFYILIAGLLDIYKGKL
jgi:hypothetical protein|tara:strand:+ start:493 stop:693 length:201 start_codon:yes stop_codon:yes gene_type:complete